MMGGKKIIENVSRNDSFDKKKNEGEDSQSCIK